jgi:hypothetical protein
MKIIEPFTATSTYTADVLIVFYFRVLKIKAFVQKFKIIVWLTRSDQQRNPNQYTAKNPHNEPNPWQKKFIIIITLILLADGKTGKNVKFKSDTHVNERKNVPAQDVV